MLWPSLGFSFHKSDSDKIQFSLPNRCIGITHVSVMEVTLKCYHSRKSASDLFHILVNVQIKIWQNHGLLGLTPVQNAGDHTDQPLLIIYLDFILVALCVLFFCFYTIDNLTMIGDPCVVALCECNDRGGDRANEVSLSPEIVDTHHLIHYTEFVVDHFSLISTHYFQMWTTVFFS